MFFKKLRLLFTYGQELEVLLKKERKRITDENDRKNKYRLKLCEKHNPVPKLTNYAEHNCDYCKLLKEFKITRGTLCQSKLPLSHL